MRHTSSSILFPVLIATSCVWTPANRSFREKGAALTLSGYVDEPGLSVKIKARNYNNDTTPVLTTVVASNTEAVPGSGLYAWSATLTNLVTSDDYWLPPQIGTLATGTSAPGRLELSAHLADDTALPTFSAAAQACVGEHINDGDTLMEAGLACYDGEEVVLFDNTGVANGAEPLEWDTDFTLTEGAIKWSRVHYESQGQTIYAFVCWPAAAPPPAGYPVHVVNHGGTRGLANDYDLPLCKAYAAQGWVTAMSTYRGEGIWVHAVPEDPPQAPVVMSDGAVELCLGEVTDVMRMLAILPQERPEADMDHVLMSGVSHGGCITARAVERGAPVHAAIDVFGPTDWTLLHDECSGTTCDAVKNYLVQTAAGGTPLQRPNAYDWRSPRHHDALSRLFAGDLAARTDVQFFILQGEDDTLVLPNQSCLLAEDAWGTDSLRYYVETGGTTDPSAVVDGCDQPWSTGNRPLGAWPSNRYLMVYEGANHGGGGKLIPDWLDIMATLLADWT